MTKTILIIACIFFIVLAVAFSVKRDDGQNKDHMLQVESAAFNTSSGWGYNILVDHKIFIHQEYIPSIAGRKSFTTKDDAIKTASLVIKKIMQQKSPGISVTDLQVLKISY